ncbi:MAG: helix-turn-helix domain-containing protein [Bacteroidetes bacterium]|nr:helix-turn-helix domain-containing protein [Bacteroidota bacterium]
MSKIEINPQFEQVLNFINHTNQIVFLTGKAGTGKTTLLKYIKQNTYKQISVVAPTGVAAINAGGSTIHSFFQFPFTPFLPSLREGIPDKNSLPVLKYNSQRLAIFKNLELLVIDEVSMVRADMMDQIDATLRQTRKKWHLPFGGVQVMLIGDMYQLSPVVQNEEWRILSDYYNSPYFFDSLVIKNNPPVFIELDKIYRQNESTFIELLNKVRNNIMDLKDLELLNSHYKANITQEDYQNNVTLTTHNRKADEINLRSLKALPGKEYKFFCKVDGNFSEKNYPADEQLILKIGTRVMFLKNNVEKNYYNGKIGVVSYIDQDSIKVKCDEDKYEIEVQREEWTNVSYKVDKSTKHIEEEVLGTFKQYPLRLAWAITIHKSQGLTFDKLIIDAAEAFSSGQVYVALSRCRGLKGLTLSSKISPQSLMNDKRIVEFSTNKQDHEQVNSIFSGSRKNYIKTVLTGLFDLNEMHFLRSDAGGIVMVHKTRVNKDGLEWSENFFQHLDSLCDVSRKFTNQLGSLVEAAHNVETDVNLQSRIQQAAVYFEVELKKCVDKLKNCTLVTESKEASTELNEIFQNLFDGLFQKQALIKTLTTGFVFTEFIKNKLQLKYPEFKLNIYASAKNTKVNSDVDHPALYRSLLLLRDEICNDEQKPIYMVANNKALTELANYLPTKESDLLQITGFGKARAEAYGEQFLKLIKDYMLENDLETKMGIKAPKKAKKSKKEKEEKLAVSIKEADGDEWYSLNDVAKEKPKEKEKKTPTKEQTFRLFKEGKKLDEIARERGFALSTVEGHLIPYIASGELNIDYLVSRQKQSLILKALENFKYETGLNPVKASLPEDISFSEIRYVLAGKLKDKM